MQDIFSFVPTSKRLIALTFDDGPTPGVTDRIAEVLLKYGAKGTFFAVGKEVAKNPDILAKLDKDGHEIGIHSYSHRKGMKDWTMKGIRDDFLLTSDAIGTAVGKKPTLIRPPFGNVSEDILSAIFGLGCSYVGWSLNARDWTGTDWTSRVIGKAIPGDVIVFHDGNRVNAEKANKTIPLFEELLRWGSGEGYSFVTFSSLMREWDTSLEKTIGGNRLLGLRLNISDGKTLVTAIWDSSDAIGGINFVVSAGGQSVSARIEPMSNVDDWLKTVKVEGKGVIVSTVQLPQDKNGLKLNLGCGKHILAGWENLDPRTAIDPNISNWEWNETLPFSDGSVSVVLIQHSLQHCAPKDYDRNFSEVRRVLEPGGKLLVKEADCRYYVWHNPGHMDKIDGLIASKTSEPEVVEVLGRNGFIGITADKDILVPRYSSVLTRSGKVNGKSFFLVEGTKPGG